MSTVKAAKPKHTTHPVLGKLPAGWKAVRLGEVVEKVGSGVTPRGGDKVYLKAGVPFVRSQNIGWGELLLDDLAFVDPAVHNDMRATELQHDDVLLNISGASIGRGAMVNGVLVGGNVNQHVCIIRTKKKELDPSFLLTFLLSHNGQKQIDSFQAGGNREGLNYNQIRSFWIPLPPLTEQRRIAGILGTWDRAIALLGQQIAAKEERLRGLIDQLVSGQRHGAKDGKLPKGWKWVELGEAVVKQSAKYDPTQGQESLPVVELENIESGSGRIIGDLRANGQLSMKNRFKAGQVLFGKLRPYLRKHVRPAFDGACSSEVWVLEGKRGVCDNGFLFSLVQSQRFIGRCLQTTGSKMPRADWEHLSSYAFAFPPIDEQVRIADIVATLRKEHEMLLAKLEQLQEQKRGLMQGLLGGGMNG